MVNATHVLALLNNLNRCRQSASVELGQRDTDNRVIRDRLDIGSRDDKGQDNACFIPLAAARSWVQTPPQMGYK